MNLTCNAMISRLKVVCRIENAIALLDIGHINSFLADVAII